MNVIFFEVDGVLNFKESEARAPDGRLGIVDSMVKELKRKTDETGSKLVLTGAWAKDWDFQDEKCTKAGAYLNKKMDRRGLHIMDKTKDISDAVDEWLRRHPNVEKYEVLKGDSQ